MQAAEVHQRMATARKNFDAEVNSTFIEDLKSFMNLQLDEAQVNFTEMAYCCYLNVLMKLFWFFLESQD